MTGGRLFAVVGPSGAGKDTLIEGVRAARPDLVIVRRVITRPADKGGEPYEGVTEPEFMNRKQAGEFALDWQAHGLFYGIPLSQVVMAAAGRDVLFNGSRAALPLARERFAGLRVIVVTASPQIIAARMAARGRETEADIAQRLTRGGFAVPEGAVTITNDGSPEEGIGLLLRALQPDRG